ncbi:MBL fold metallo-hydrolase [Microbulbifer sp. CAU 1566]|uniref:MBL fold metallo-hydrolase RNA specificity domain-containing protein n=1 Tax=Microbulbifer sp. CAU 1566 TaxID=2933269 RepID=UPI002006CF6E|nr:MBL fold metallo-hydrolase [Microbulbifer sp. CAU 1566]MCK7598410.1 MBL fold metallo-hydrolase [Microbulbifer sp. CAU 1566]
MTATTAAPQSATAGPAPVAFGRIQHHGAVDGVTGSCHQLYLDEQNSILIDCGLFQGAETSPGGSKHDRLEIEFPIDSVKALVVTHVHIDHCGRIPYLIAAGFRGPIYCSEPSAELLPLVLEDALKIGVTRNKALIEQFLGYIKAQLRPLSYNTWQPVIDEASNTLNIRLQRAGHILGSAYVECDLKVDDKTYGQKTRRTLFSGDLGAPNTPLLYGPTPSEGCDELVIESTYGDRIHENREQRAEKLHQAIERALKDGGSVLIPAFSIGRTQELLYEIENIIHEQKQKLGEQSPWHDLPVVVDSPLASRFTEVYRRLEKYWDQEAQAVVQQGRHPLSFEQLITVDDHATHQKMVNRLAHTKQPTIVIAASGMCAGGRIVDYLKAMLEDERHNIIFVGYQAKGTPGRDIQKYGPRHGYVELDGERLNIKAGIETIGGYSAHADQNDLLDFIQKMEAEPRAVRIVHGDDRAKQNFQIKLQSQFKSIKIQIPILFAKVDHDHCVSRK